MYGETDIGDAGQRLQSVRSHSSAATYSPIHEREGNSDEDEANDMPRDKVAREWKDAKKVNTKCERGEVLRGGVGELFNHCKNG